MRISVESLHHHLNVFMWENPGWEQCEIVWNNDNGGKILARKPHQKPKALDIEWEFRQIWPVSPPNFLEVE